MSEVISIGSATLDIFVRSNQFKLISTDQVATGVALCEMYGAKIDVDDIHLSTGGGATNSAVSFARKGIPASCIIELGEDLPADMVLTDLKKAGVDTANVIQEPSEKTAISVVLNSPEGGRSIVTYRGASKMLGSGDIPWQSMLGEQKPKWFYISSLGGQIELLEKLIKFANQNGIKLAVNPGSGEIKQTHTMLSLVPEIDILIMNQEEAGDLYGIPYNQPKQIFEAAKNSGGKISLITQGSEGAHLISEGKLWFCPPSHTEMLEATGAGDAFGSGFVAGQILGWDMNASAQLARANAGSVITYVGAKQGLLTLDQYEKLNKSNGEITPLNN